MYQAFQVASWMLTEDIAATGASGTRSPTC
jgi:hypothetical protein